MNETLDFKFTILSYSEPDRSIFVRYYTDAIFAGWKPLLEKEVARLTAGWPHMDIEETYRLAADHAPLGITLNLWLPDPAPTGDALLKFIARMPRRSPRSSGAMTTSPRPQPDLKHVEQHMRKEHVGSFTPEQPAPVPMPSASTPGRVQLRRVGEKVVPSSTV
jgi:hypothetical protein